MEFKICVRIKTGEFVDALDLAQARHGTLHLTTIEDYQTAAEIPVFFVRGVERTPLAVLTVERLDPFTSEQCRLDLETRVSGRNRAEFRVVQNGKLLLTESRKLPIPWPGWKYAGAAAVLAVLAGAGILAFSLLRGRLPDSRSARGGVSAPAETARPEASDSRSAAPAAPAPRTTAEVPAAPAAPTGTAPAAGSGTEAAAPAAGPVTGDAARAVEALPAAPAASPAPYPEASAAPADPLRAAREAFQALGGETLTIYFPPDSAEIQADQRSKLAEAAALLARYPDLAVEVSGHCATAGTEKGRMALSRDRARAVFAVLAAAGWKPSRAPLVEGYGDEKPVTRAEDEQSLNRRVEIRLAP